MYIGRTPNNPITSGRGVAVHIVEPKTLVREALGVLLYQQNITVASASGHLPAAAAVSSELRSTVLLVSITSDMRFFEDLRTWLPGADSGAVVLLDERPIDAHARQALQLGIGYLTKTQSGSELASALAEAASGTMVLDPAIADRLDADRSGLRLAGTPSGPFEQLTPREIDVLVQISQGLTVKECAKTLGISASTVDNHKARLMRKLNIHKTVELTRLALVHGLLPGEPLPDYSAAKG